MAITLGLTWLWSHGAREAYGRFLVTFVPPLLDLTGAGDVRIGPLRERYINWIPFVGLMGVTLGLSWRRRAIGLLTGLLLLCVGHVAVNFFTGPGRASHLPLVPSLVSDTLPFLLWVVIAWPAIGEWLSARGAAKLAKEDTLDEAD